MTRYGSFYNIALLICESIKKTEHERQEDVLAFVSSILTALRKTKKVRADYKAGKINKHQQHLRAKTIWADDMFKAVPDGASQHTSSAISLVGSDPSLLPVVRDRRRRVYQTRTSERPITVIVRTRGRASSNSVNDSDASFVAALRQRRVDFGDLTDSESSAVNVPIRRRASSRSLTGSEPSVAIGTSSRRDISR